MNKGLVKESIKRVYEELNSQPDVTEKALVVYGNRQVKLINYSDDIHISYNNPNKVKDFNVLVRPNALYQFLNLSLEEFSNKLAQGYVYRRLYVHRAILNTEFQEYAINRKKMYNNKLKEELIRLKLPKEIHNRHCIEVDIVPDYGIDSRGGNLKTFLTLPLKEEDTSENKKITNWFAETIYEYIPVRTTNKQYAKFLLYSTQLSMDFYEQLEKKLISLVR